MSTKIEAKEKKYKYIKRFNYLSFSVDKMIVDFIDVMNDQQQFIECISFIFFYSKNMVDSVKISRTFVTHIAKS